MIAIADLMLAEARRNFLTWVRYPLQPLVGLAMLLLLFAGLAFGVERFPALGLFEAGGTTQMVGAFFCWVVAMGAMGHVSSEIEEDAKLGTLENVFTSRFRASTVVLVRSLSSSLGGLAMAVLTLWLIAWYSDAQVRIGPASIAALVVLDIALSGVGMLMAGASVVLKRISSIAPLLYLGFGIAVAALVAPEPVDARFHYPVLSALELFSRALFGLPFGLGQAAAAVGWSLASLFAGVAAFDALSNVARARGSISHS